MNITKIEKKGWFISLIGALFFFYAFIQANVLTPLSGEISKAFDANASILSFLSAWYFYANILFILPAGLMLDRYSVKLLMIISIFFAIIGTFMLAFAPDIKVAYLGRFLSGIMMSFGLVSCLKLASLLLPSCKMALASSLIVTIGMIGGVFAQAPVAYLSQNIGWRNSLAFLAFLGGVIAMILWFVVKEPKNAQIQKEKMDQTIIESLKEVCMSKQNWYCGLFISLVNFPIAILGALFGVPYLTQAHGFSYLDASAVTSMLFVGMIFGSPFFGWLSDYIKNRKLPMYIGSLACLLSIFILIYAPKMESISAYALFFFIGFTSASQVLGYPVIAESNPSKISGTALSLAAFLIMGLGYGIGIPFVGWILDLTWNGQMIDGMNHYSLASYQQALLTLPIAVILGVLMVYFMKETKCQSICKK